jgi:glycosyltransferase involved in cell wall biosynthesis
MADRCVVASAGWESASTRHRIVPLARRGDIPFRAVVASSRPTPEQVGEIVGAGGEDATLILQRVLPSKVQTRQIAAAYSRVMFDFDDAVYAVPPSVASSAVRDGMKAGLRLLLRGSPSASSRRHPLVRLLGQVDMCVAGNRILGDFARRYAADVVEIPTTVEPVEPHGGPPPDPPVLVWMGLPDNLQYLELLREPLTQLGRERRLRLRIVSGVPWPDPPVPAEFVPWSEEAAREALLGSSIGLAPLTDDPWTRGKCALRAIQYGGHGLPTVASPVGITSSVVLHEQTGYLARSPQEWLAALRALLDDPARAALMGTHARRHVGEHFSDAVAVRAWRRVLEG